MQAEPVEQIDNMGGKTHADRHVRAGVLQDQIPADDPGDQLAQRGVGVGVGRAGNGNHRGQFGIAEAGERADNGHQHHGERDGRAGARPAGQRRVGDDVVAPAAYSACWWRIELLAGNRRADDREDARANHGADAQRGQRPRPERLLEPVLGLFRVADQLVDRLAGKQLVRQVQPLASSSWLLAPFG